ncbi:IS66 family transposase [Pseudomonas wenzhouensis]|nr:IS66 family transposase [Pseudomonas wenzhouensis]MDM9654099.1 IS66 family transposase [Pseudomonas wenzhouensis]
MILPTSTPAATDESMPALVRQNRELRDQVAALKHQLDWFKRQLFGAKSERFVPEVNPQQLHLGEALPIPDATPEQRQRVPAHTRRVAQTDLAQGEAGLPFFDETKVPVETITLPSPEAEALLPEQYEVIGEKTSFRLAQRPGSYVVLKYVRPLIKRRDTDTLHCAPAPAGVIEGSRADVSLIAGLLVDKFAYHLPLYRQHQRMTDAGIKVSRPWLTQLVQQGAALLEPIYQAQFASIRMSRVKAMDETPIKAGRDGPGKMKAAYFWPVYGEHDEVCFPFFASRRAEHVQQALGLTPAQGAVLLTDGYGAYRAYARKTGITQASCWAHARRELFEAKNIEPQIAEQALQRITALYAVEEAIRQQQLKGEAKRLYRLTHSKPLVEELFAWIDEQFERHGLLPSNPMTKALAYARERRAGLEVFLTDPDVPIDTNHLERALRAIPMGRKAWLFCWTEVGAQHVGLMQSLIVTCRLHGIDPYTYLVDVLQRVGQHPAARVAELTPRLWKQHFASNPLRSDLHRATA